MLEFKDSGRVVASGEAALCTGSSTENNDSPQPHGHEQNSRFRKRVGPDPTCLRDADLLAGNHNLPLTRVLALMLAKMPLYASKAARAEGKHHHNKAVSPERVDMYNKLVGTAYWLDVSDRDDPWIFEVVGQGSYATMFQVMDAIRTIARSAHQVREYEPFFLDLRRSLAMLADFLAFVCGGRPDQLWGADGSAMRRFLADFQDLCGSKVPEGRVIDCWNSLTRETDASYPRASITPLKLTRTEKAELNAWRAKLAAGS